MVLMFTFIFFATLLPLSSAFSRMQLLATELKFTVQKMKKQQQPRHSSRFCQTAIFSHGTPDKALQEAIKFQKKAMLTAFAALGIFNLNPGTAAADTSALLSPASISAPLSPLKNLPSTSSSTSSFSQNTIGPPASALTVQSSDSQVKVNLPSGFRESIAKGASSIPGTVNTKYYSDFMTGGLLMI